MNINQKGSANIALIAIIVILAGAVVYFAFGRKSEPIAQQITPAPASKTFPESEVIGNLKTNWPTIQTLIPFRPEYHNQAENAKKTWRPPFDLQFIGKNNILAEFEDDNNPHIAVFNFNGGEFSLLEILKDQGDLILSDWQDVVHKYGDPSYPVGTYTLSLMRNKEIVNFQDLTKVPENIFVRNYWEN